jgi:hypothetical protein
MSAAPAASDWRAQKPSQRRQQKPQNNQLEIFQRFRLSTFDGAAQ